MQGTLKKLFCLGLVMAMNTGFATPKLLCLPGTQAAPENDCKKVVLNTGQKGDKCEKYYYATSETKSKTKNTTVYQLCKNNTKQTSPCMNGSLQCKMPPFTPITSPSSAQR